LSGHALLQIAAIWRGQIIGYRLLARRRRITVGPSKRATFNTPPLQGRKRYLLVRPRKGAYLVHLAPGLRGELTLGGLVTPTATSRWPPATRPGWSSPRASCGWSCAGSSRPS
jgi:hypothetical protein